MSDDWRGRMNQHIDALHGEHPESSEYERHLDAVLTCLVREVALLRAAPEPTAEPEFAGASERDHRAAIEDAREAIEEGREVDEESLVWWVNEAEGLLNEVVRLRATRPPSSTEEPERYTELLAQARRSIERYDPIDGTDPQDDLYHYWRGIEVGLIQGHRATAEPEGDPRKVQHDPDWFRAWSTETLIEFADIIEMVLRERGAMPATRPPSEATIRDVGGVGAGSASVILLEQAAGRIRAGELMGETHAIACEEAAKTLTLLGDARLEDRHDE